MGKKEKKAVQQKERQLISRNSASTEKSIKDAENEAEMSSKNNNPTKIGDAQSTIAKLRNNGEDEELTLARRTFKWNIASIIVNALLLICTLGALFYTHRSVGISNETLNETKSQFEIGNKPFLHIVEIKPDSPRVGQLYRIEAKIANYGNYPVKILFSKAMFNATMPKFSPPPAWDTIHSINTPEVSENTYLVKDYPIVKSVVFDRPLDRMDYNTLLLNLTEIYFIGYIVYQDEIKNDRWIYKFMILYKYSDPPYFRILKSTNERYN